MSYSFLKCKKWSIFANFYANVSKNLLHLHLVQSNLEHLKDLIVLFQKNISRYLKNNENFPTSRWHKASWGHGPLRELISLLAKFKMSQSTSNSCDIFISFHSIKTQILGVHSFLLNSCFWLKNSAKFS